MQTRLVRILACLFAFSVLCFAGNAWLVRADGVGPVKIGMTITQLSTVLHEQFELPADKEERACYYLQPSANKHIAFMMEQDKLIRIDVNAHGVTTSEGLQVGDDEARVVKIYGARAKVTPHKYSETGHYVTVEARGSPFGIRFETEKGKVRLFYAGTTKAIQYVEGCDWTE